MAGPGGGAGARGARRRTVASRALLAAIAVVLLAAVGLAVFVLRGPRGGPSGSPASGGPSPSGTPSASLADLPPGPLNILVMGSDIRGNARDAVAGQEAGGGVADQRADMIMLLHVQTDHRRVFGISIMRDSWVTIPGHGPSKINASLSWGGPPLVVETVASLLSVRIDHYAMLDFEGFKAITDALGGVDVDVPVPFTATFDTHHTFSPSINRLDGQAALEFVRERYAFPDGDYQRVRDQQAFIRGLSAQLVTTGRVGSPAEAAAAVGLASPYVIGDPGLDAAGLATLGYGLRGLDPASSTFFTLPTAGTGLSDDGQSIVVPDYPGIAAVAEALRSDTLGQYAVAHGLS